MPKQLPPQPSDDTAAIYARVSTDDKGQDPDNQVRVLKSLVSARGWTLTALYVDQESGGTSKRQRFQDMLEDARKAQFHILVFWSLDRFSREGTFETLEHLRRLDTYGVRFLSHQEQYLDTLGPFREAVIGILAAVAKIERQRLSERVKAGMSRAKAQGVNVGRPQSDIDPDAITQAYSDGWSLAQMSKAFVCGRSTISRRLKELGLK